jgi:hypothetical protein
MIPGGRDITPRGNFPIDRDTGLMPPGQRWSHRDRMTTTNVELSARTGTIRTGLIAAGIGIIAAASAFYGAYGDPHPKANQEGAVPFLVGVDVVLTGLIFVLLVPWAARRPGRAAGWGLALSLVALVTMLFTFWSGINVIIAAAGAVLGLLARRTATGSTGTATAATVIGVISAVASTALLVLGNTVLA